MREIKFRCWHKSTKDMIYPDRLRELTMNMMSEDDEDILMQYIDLKDKNGKEIYEGDIIKYYNSIGEYGIGIIESFFDTVNLHCRWIEQKTENPSLFTSIDYLGCSEEIELIGNIYENSELLRS
jgi:uncharacterized phage protein (TIGR01671 family)